MKNAIKEYLDLSEEEKKTIWENAVFVFDTNILLNLYRYTGSTRKNLLDSMKKLKDRIWLPYQVAYEFMKDRPEIIFETERRYEELKRDGSSFINNLSNHLRLPNNDASLKNLHETIDKWIDERKKNDLTVTHPSNDGLLSEILELFDEKVGKKPCKEDSDKIIAEGKQRYAKKIPPGYKDAGKADRGDNSEYGDLFAWKEIIDFSKENKKDIIYITNDNKEDWWYKINGKTLGPRIELKKEFSEETNKNFLLYTMDNFIDYMNKDGTGLSKEAINEIKTTSPVPSPSAPCQTITANTSPLYNIEKRIYHLEHIIAQKTSVIDLLNRDFNRTHNPNIIPQIINTQQKLDSLKRELKELRIRRDIFSHYEHL
jgi:hypothetical protein